jgi:manganese transport protein
VTNVAAPSSVRPSWSQRTEAAAREAVLGQRRGVRALLPFLGPALIASVAYMDPGNYATNIEAGAKFGYTLLWVVVVANAMAMIFQALSAKLGIVTGHSLAQHCRAEFPRPVVYAMWTASEVGAMATDLAEFLGGAIGLSLLFGLSLPLSLLITGIATYAILLIQGAGFRPMEAVIGAFVSVIGVCYLIELVISPPDWVAFAYHSVVPQLSGPHSITLAVGIVGATVMPHAIYLHSSLTQDRVPTKSDEETRRVLRFSNTDVLIALGMAGLVNMAMIAMSASVFHDGIHNDVAQIETAYRTLTPLLGAGAAAVFMASLLSSGRSSSVVGTMAGQVIMEHFVSFSLPLWVRRIVTMLPAFVVVWLGVDSTQALIYSQVVLSIVLPIPMIALLMFTSRRRIMGPFTNSTLTTIVASACAIAVLGLNILLLTQIAGAQIPSVGD